MLPKVLLVHDIPAIQSICAPLRRKYSFITVGELNTDADTGPGGYPRFAAVIHSFSELQQNTPPLPSELLEPEQETALLYSTEDQLATAIDYANNNGYFRTITNNTSSDTLSRILLDASSQTALVDSVAGLNEKVKQLNRLDQPTGCANRRHGLETLHINLRRAKRYAQYISVVLCSVDNLAEINRTYGHLTGDAVLKTFGDFGNNQLRKNIDVLARLREDTFFLILPETGIRGAGKVAERFRKGFASLTIQTEEKTIGGTLSLGATCYAPEYPERNDSAEGLIQLAERCLAQAQSAGGDMVLCCP